MAAIRAYPGLGNSKRVTFEYVMLKGVNDSLAEARALVNLLGGARGRKKLPPRGGLIYGRASSRVTLPLRRKSQMAKKAANWALYRQKNRLKG